MKKWVCGTCGYVWDGDNPPNSCPKCGAPKEKFTQLPDDKAKLIDRSRLTNDLHMKLDAMMTKIMAVAEEGIKDNPGLRRGLQQGQGRRGHHQTDGQGGNSVPYKQGEMGLN